MRDAGHRTPDIGQRTAKKAKIIYPPPRGVDIIIYNIYLPQLRQYMPLDIWDFKEVQSKFTLTALTARLHYTNWHWPLGQGHLRVLKLHKVLTLHDMSNRTTLRDILSVSSIWMAGSVRIWRTWLHRLSPPLFFSKDDRNERKGPELVGLQQQGPGISCYRYLTMSSLLGNSL